MYNEPKAQSPPAQDTSIYNGASAIAELSSKHCVFLSGDNHFALAATAVREISQAPPLVRLPRSPASLAGLCHVRSEFLPVVLLNSLLGDSSKTDAKSNIGLKQLLILTSNIGPWALLIDRVIAIDTIETHVDSQNRDNNHLSPVLGTASFESNVIRVLNPSALHLAAAQSLQAQWAPTATTTTRNTCA